MQSIKKILSITILIVCACFLFSYGRNHLSDFSNITSVSVGSILLIALLSAVALAVNGLFLKFLTVDFGIDLRFLEYFSISVVTSFGNVFLPMKGGAGFRAVYLKAKYNFDYSYFLSTLAGNYLVSFHIVSIIALVAMATHYLQAGSVNVPATAIFSGITVCTGWGIFFPPRALDWIPVVWVRERMNSILSGWRVTSQAPNTVFMLFLLTVLNLFLGSAITWFEFAALGMKDSSGTAIGIIQAVLFNSIGNLSFLVSVTPAALGIKESLLMLSSGFLGISPSQALAVSLLDRTITFLVLTLLFVFASLYLRKNSR